MKKITFTSMLLFMSCFICLATTHIVDSHYPRPAGVFATIQLAYDAASIGDTILISPALGQYDGIALTKRVHIVGTGWADPSGSVPHTKTSGFTFNAGSQGSSISGLEINGMIQISTDSITVKRNKLLYIYVGASSTNIVIVQNFIIANRQMGYWYDGSIIAIWENTEVFISNNIIINTGNVNQNHGIYTSFPTNVIVCNNVLRAEESTINIGMSGGNYSPHSVFNNIIVWGGGTSGVSTAFSVNNHNIGNSTQFAAINNNQQNVDMSTVFVDATNYNYHLKEGSPAIGAGLDGTDCGIYGGPFPFVDNGRTWLPILTEMSVPALVNVKDGLDVSVKAKSGK